MTAVIKGWLDNLKGWFGERVVQFAIWLYLDAAVYARFHNIIVSDKNGTTEIDHVIVCKYGIFVIETKTMQGRIYGGEDDLKWRQSFGKGARKNFLFQNPIHQNKRHIKCLAETLQLDESLFHSVVLFTGGARLCDKDKLPASVMARNPSSHIKSFAKPLLNEDLLLKVKGALGKIKLESASRGDEHLRSLKERHQGDKCPKCGAALVEKVAKKGANAGGRFLACSAFPRCRHTRPLK